MNQAREEFSENDDSSCQTESLGAESRLFRFHEKQFLHLKCMILDGPGHPGIFLDHSWIDSRTFIFFMKIDHFGDERPARLNGFHRQPETGQELRVSSVLIKRIQIKLSCPQDIWDAENLG